MGLTENNWQILGASVTGTSHRKDGRGCEDFHAYRVTSSGVLLFAVADGAGSASHAAEGAQYAVNSSLAAMADWLAQYPEPKSEHEWYVTLVAVLHATRNAVRMLAGQLGASMPSGEPTDSSAVSILSPESSRAAKSPMRRFATTLLLAALTPNWISVLQVGDGGIVIRKNDGTLATLTQPEHGEYINETSFITDDNLSNHFQYRAVPLRNVQGIALFTDGMQMLALNLATNEPYEPFFTPLFASVTQKNMTDSDVAEFLDSDRVCARTDDDKTLVLAIRS